MQFERSNDAARNFKCHKGCRVKALHAACRPVVECLERRTLLSGTVSGTVFVDANADGVRDLAEVPLAGWIVFADYDGDRVLDDGEPTAVSGADGHYTLLTTQSEFQVDVVDGQAWDVTPVIVEVNPGTEATNVDVGSTEAAHRAPEPVGRLVRLYDGLEDQYRPRTAADRYGNFVVV